jgi:tripartite-type tricarboxylate transporter receptor subunit TctC
MSSLRSSTSRLLGLLIALFACAAAAQSYPSKPVRIVVPFSPGGGTDIAARILAQKLTERMGQSFLVDNRPGASGIIGTELVAKSPPDGYTLLVGSQTVMAVVPAMYANLSYDTQRDFVPVIQLVDTPTLIVVAPSLPVKSVKDLIALARSRPGQLTFGGASGGTPHLFGELFKQLARIDMLFVPYKGESPALSDTMAGQISMVFANLPTALPIAQAGKVRALAVSSAQRVSSAPGVPTVAESGLPDYKANSWFGLYAPAATPRAIVVKINAETASGLNAPDVKERLTAQGMFVVADTPEQFAAFLKTEIPRWTQVVKASGVKPQ